MNRGFAKKKKKNSPNPLPVFTICYRIELNTGGFFSSLVPIKDQGRVYVSDTFTLAADVKHDQSCFVGSEENHRLHGRRASTDKLEHKQPLRAVPSAPLRESV